jgi:hypothetical protein
MLNDGVGNVDGAHEAFLCCACSLLISIPPVCACLHENNCWRGLCYKCLALRACGMCVVLLRLPVLFPACMHLGSVKCISQELLAHFWKQHFKLLGLLKTKGHC